MAADLLRGKQLVPSDRETKTLAQRVRASEARSIGAGAVRMPGGLLPAEAATALSDLVDAGYAASKTAVIAKALIETRRRVVNKCK